ncbi:MAG: acyl-CoA carboxylase biotin carboxyl carrier protein subunit, partial [Planctomycetota bacterium]
IGETILLGLMGMTGVFIGLTLLAVSLVLLPELLQKMGWEAAGTEPKKARQEEKGTPAPAPEPAPEPERAPPAVTGGSTPSRTPWQLAQGPFARPSMGQWIGPAFRAAFREGSVGVAGEQEILVGGKPFRVAFLSLEGSVARLRVNGRELVLDLGEVPETPPTFAAPPPAPAPRPAMSPPAPPKRAVPKPSPPPAPTPSAASPSAPAPEEIPGGGVAVKAPIPGTMKGIKVQVGESVERGQLLFLVEAMKMDNEINSPVAGKIKEIRVQEKAAIRQGEILAILEP